MKTLLIVDMQKGFIEGDNLLVNKVNKIVASGQYDNIFLTQYKNDISKNSLYKEKIGWNRLTTKEEQDFAINVPHNAIIFEKFSYGLQPDQLEYISSLNEKTIDICGVQAEACVYAISLQLWDRGIYPNILINYVEGNPQLKDNMKEIFIKQFGAVDERVSSWVELNFLGFKE